MGFQFYQVNCNILILKKSYSAFGSSSLHPLVSLLVIKTTEKMLNSKLPTVVIKLMGDDSLWSNRVDANPPNKEFLIKEPCVKSKLELNA